MISHMEAIQNHESVTIGPSGKCLGALILKGELIAEITKMTIGDWDDRRSEGGNQNGDLSP